MPHRTTFIGHTEACSIYKYERYDPANCDCMTDVERLRAENRALRAALAATLDIPADAPALAPWRAEHHDLLEEIRQTAADKATPGS